MCKTLVAAINKPRVIAGIDKKLLSGCFLSSFVGAFMGQQFVGEWRGIAIGVVMFCVLCTAAMRMTKKDQRMLSILLATRKQKAIYDPGKVEGFRIVLTQETS